MLFQRILPPHTEQEVMFGPTINTPIRRKTHSYLGLLRRSDMQGRSCPSIQRLSAQKRAGPAGTNGPVPPAPGDRSHRVQSRGQPGEKGERLLGRLTHCEGRIHLPHDPIQNRQPGVPAGADEKVPNRHPDVLVEQLGCGIHQPEKKIVSN
jgi:hypothetical protein